MNPPHENEEERRKVDEQLRIFNAVTQAWLDEKFAQFGRFSFYFLMAVVFVLILKGIFAIKLSDLRYVLEIYHQTPSHGG